MKEEFKQNTKITAQNTPQVNNPLIKAENIIKIKQGYPEETKDISVDLNNINI